MGLKRGSLGFSRFPRIIKHAEDVNTGARPAYKLVTGARLDPSRHRGIGMHAVIGTITTVNYHAMNGGASSRYHGEGFPRYH
jgi:hypothetical protein